jgi:hypothetical protein
MQEIMVAYATSKHRLDLPVHAWSEFSARPSENLLSSGSVVRFIYVMTIETIGRLWQTD